MFFEARKSTRRRFFLASLGGLAATLGAGKGIAELLSSRMEGQKTTVGGEEKFRIVVTGSPTNSVWTLEQSPDLNSWTNVASSNSVSVGTGKLEWDIPRANQSAFFRAKLVTVTIRIKNGASYQVPLISGQKLLEAMESLKVASPSFTFEYEWRDFGQFVTKINGVAYPKWVFTVNGQRQYDPSPGVADYIVKSGGDIFEWLKI